ncbi:uncharacterized protein OCT59_017009 [Rhizophagus irregularis]|uniref:Uncharacterized protein n=2 Tax=Rhizophagus irregularis TaxID=588596 RepID=U9TUZ2_RHIID|nr:hypothetical protein GLOIN_2v1793349 [Rhizophagus irregularis DAOM 181602=DAOM 197198]EXX65165.1 hypothetical protein RirG_135870 [Rhizophagus irregularis DAOM 197198w]POG71744.1 hypothetical protein GLOIN_2v1793349 [Rhizophagus irregularis DAOM 181602=DAOM 197198]UZO24715.1 hypothetical protein OCT59_017009 [Rhizophagus irregularis]GBC14634.1 kinase-like domain-containing protein [Rhizophagus irregularis DAOM 181602=DAOM 197198]|eukprot:XP_025178610.1 hypothetical protein GLOIN_2v1793349 [Rhizophagus irregularis DAOM 181602=DAOM 197198]
MSTSQENNILPSSPLPYENLSPMASATSSRNNNIQQPIAPSLAFFYNPPSFLISYHITCEEIPVSFELVYQLTNDADDRAYNYVLPDSYVFYHSQFNTKKIYRVTCELASSQFLNKRFYNMEYNQQSNQQHQQQQEISLTHFKFHLKQFLTNYLAHGNMVHDNFSDETMDGPPSFRNTTNGDYTQDYENNPSLFNPNIDNIQQDV